MNFNLRNFTQRLLGASPEASSFMAVSSEKNQENPLARLMQDQQSNEQLVENVTEVDEYGDDDGYDHLTSTMALDPSDQETYALSTQIFNKYKDLKLPLDLVVENFNGKAYLLINSRWLIEIVAQREQNHLIGSHRLLRIGSLIPKNQVMNELTDIYKDLSSQTSIDWSGTGALQSNAEIDALQELLAWLQSDHLPFDQIEPWQEYWLDSMITILIHTNDNARMGYKRYVSAHGSIVQGSEQRQKQVKYLLESAATPVTEV